MHQRRLTKSYIFGMEVYIGAASRQEHWYLGFRLCDNPCNHRYMIPLCYLGEKSRERQKVLELMKRQ